MQLSQRAFWVHGPVVLARRSAHCVDTKRHDDLSAVVAACSALIRRDTQLRCYCAAADCAWVAALVPGCCSTKRMLSKALVAVPSLADGLSYGLRPLGHLSNVTPITGA